jgi:5-bromo-4-chloroindolyl phosphate hydrolysis protein
VDAEQVKFKLKGMTIIMDMLIVTLMMIVITNTVMITIIMNIASRAKIYIMGQVQHMHMRQV